MTNVYTIIDILYTGNAKGPRGVSKKGWKYDERRGAKVRITSDIQVGDSVDMKALPPAAFNHLYTTLCIDFYKGDDGYYYLETMNSIYKLHMED